MASKSGTGKNARSGGASAAKGAFSVRAYGGDAKTLLAFNLDKPSAKNLAGFTIFVTPGEEEGYYLLNSLQYGDPAKHAQDHSLPPTSSINAPFAKFRWLHVPGQAHQGLTPYWGTYTYTVTPRYFDASGALTPLDPALSVSVSLLVQPFEKGAVKLGFTRGFTQSQAFVHHFGKGAAIQPKNRDLVFDTGEEAGCNAHGDSFTFVEEYEWSGFTARQRVFEILDDVVSDKSLHLDVLAYDLNEPDVMDRFLTLAKQGRIRILLDNAPLHTSKPGKPAWEDEFAKAFAKAAKKGAAIIRGHFKRFSHDKIFIVSKDGAAQTVLTGSTNFSVTGLYVNSNHVVVFEDAAVAGAYLNLFETIWQDEGKQPAWLKSEFSKKAYSFKTAGVPPTSITFSPHTEDYALSILQGIADRVAKEGKKAKGTGSVLFAVMQLDGSDSTVYKALADVHKNAKVFSFGISDTTSGIALYKPGSKGGVLVTGKPAGTVLPPPFDQVPGVGLGHQVHHKFVVCGFNSSDAVVYCGSSNLASGGEQANGDNLIAISDSDIATVFAIEAVALVDHFQFLDRCAKGESGKKADKTAAAKKKPASKAEAAASAGWHLPDDDGWTKSYFTPSDLHCTDRILFA
jgi:hypothetical protein